MATAAAKAFRAAVRQVDGQHGCQKSAAAHLGQLPLPWPTVEVNGKDHDAIVRSQLCGGIVDFVTMYSGGEALKKRLSAATFAEKSTMNNNNNGGGGGGAF